MQKVMLLSELKEVELQIDVKVLDYLQHGKTESFEGFADFYLLAFDWYDVSRKSTDTSKILIYLDREDLFFICDSSRALELTQAAVTPSDSNEIVLYQYFINLLKKDMDSLDAFENEITDAEDFALTGKDRYDYVAKIVKYRKELLRRKRYYEQLIAIFENLASDDEKLLTRNAQRHFLSLQHRVERFYQTVLSLREYVTQMREAYQSQIDIQQNDLMRMFTVITAVFFPLSLLTGWYGMNFINMPELTWQYGYPCVIALTFIICFTLILWFKKKRWF